MPKRRGAGWNRRGGEVREMLDDGHRRQLELLRDAERMKQDMMEEARRDAAEEAKRQMEAVRRAIEREKQEARREMRHEVERLALDIAGKVLRTDLSGDAGQAELVHRMMDELEDKEGGLR